MKDGLYAIKFATPFGAGAGVVVKSGNKLVGGDSGFCWSGAITDAGSAVTATVDVDKHENSVESVFGPLQSFTLNLSGVANDVGANLEGTTPSVAGVTINVTLRYLKAA